MEKLKTFRELRGLLEGLQLGDAYKFEYEYAKGCFMKSYEVEILGGAEAKWEIVVVVNERYGAVAQLTTDQVTLYKVDKGARLLESAVSFGLEGAELGRLREVTTDTMIVEIFEDLKRYVEESRE